MWYFIEKNGKAIKAYRNLGKALFFAYNKLSYNRTADVVRIVDSNGEIKEDL